jgi:hypothetical protein
LRGQVVSDGFVGWLVSNVVGVAQVEVLDIANELIALWRLQTAFSSE